MINKEAIQKRLIPVLEKQAVLEELVGFLRGRVDKKEGMPALDSLVQNGVIGAGIGGASAAGVSYGLQRLLKYLGEAPLDKRTALLIAAAYGGLGALGAMGGATLARTIVSGPPAQQRSG